jgi:hypothetical protein
MVLTPPTVWLRSYKELSGMNGPLGLNIFMKHGMHCVL